MFLRSFAFFCTEILLVARSLQTLIIRRGDFLPNNPQKKRAMRFEHPIRRETAHKLARYALFSFIVAFILARVCVFLIMSKQMPKTSISLCAGRMSIT